MTHLSDEEFATMALRSLSSVEVSADLSRRVATIPINNPHKQLWPWGRIWQPLLALGFSAVVGIYSGTLFDVNGAADGTSAAADSAAIEGKTTSQAALDSSVDEMLSLYSFAWGQDWSGLDENSTTTDSTTSDSGAEQ